MKKIFITSLLMLYVLSCFSQQIEERYLFWRPGVKLTFDMLNGELPDSVTKNKMLDNNCKHSIATGLWGVLDVPTSKKWQGKKCEKAYFCAAIDRTKSYWIVKDSIELRRAQLFWDICELSTRVARKHLQEAQREMNSTKRTNVTGVLYLWYKTCLNDGRSFGKSCSQHYLRNAIMSQDEECFNQVRLQCDSLLQEFEDYATKEEEIQRFISNTPCKGYKMSETVCDDMKNRGEIVY